MEDIPGDPTPTPPDPFDGDAKECSACRDFHAFDKPMTVRDCAYIGSCFDGEADDLHGVIDGDEGQDCFEEGDNK